MNKPLYLMCVGAMFLCRGNSGWGAMAASTVITVVLSSGFSIVWHHNTYASLISNVKQILALISVHLFLCSSCSCLLISIYFHLSFHFHPFFSVPMSSLYKYIFNDVIYSNGFGDVTVFRSFR